LGNAGIATAEAGSTLNSENAVMPAPSPSRFEEVAPPASALVESLRDIGYSLATAISDIIDNSIAARATHVEWFASPYDDEPAIGLLDNGSGMSQDELREAMRLGSKHPDDIRDEHDLGRFGLGLKTASFSQCRNLTVLTRKAGHLSGARWDLDLIKETGEWTLEFLTDYSEVPWAENLNEDGTLVVWQTLDRLVESDNKSDRSHLVEQLDEAATYVQLVFHRYLAGEAGIKKLQITFNNRRLEPFDPFHSKHPATIIGPQELFQMAGHKILIQPFTLPHHKKVTNDEWEIHAMREGYVKNQGFYIYRKYRLVIYGTWFSLARQAEITKLSRICIDMPSELDSYWKIDIKKASAQLPEALKKHLKQLIEKIIVSSKRVYIGQGSREVTSEQLPVWLRIPGKDRISYCINQEHPIIDDFEQSLSKDQSQAFYRLLRLIYSSFPVDALFADIATDPNSVNNDNYDSNSLEELVRAAYNLLDKAGTKFDSVEKALLSSNPFKAYRELTQQVLNDIRKDQINGF